MAICKRGKQAVKGRGSQGKGTRLPAAGDRQELSELLTATQYWSRELIKHPLRARQLTPGALKIKASCKLVPCL